MGANARNRARRTKAALTRREQLCKLHGPVVPGEDNVIHRINNYPVDSIVCFVSTYTLDSDLSGVKVLAPSFSVVSYPTVPPTPYFFLGPVQTPNFS